MVYSAFIFGSSKQGNALRAATGSNFDVEIALESDRMFNSEIAYYSRTSIYATLPPTLYFVCMVLLQAQKHGSSIRICNR